MDTGQRISLKNLAITALVTGAVTVATGMTLFYWQTREPRLIYRLSDTIAFESPGENWAMYHVPVTNSGRREIVDVRCLIRVAGAKLVKCRVKAPLAMPVEESTDGDQFTVALASLNPKEEITISILASSPGVLPPRPVVSLRGAGSIGTEETRQSSKDMPAPIVAAVGSAYAGLVTAFAYRRFVRRRGPHADDQRDILAFLCGAHGLLDESARLLSLERKASYWSEADRLGNIAARTDDVPHRTIIKRILTDLLSYAAISSESRGVIFYNLAKISKVEGDTRESSELLNQARSHARRVVEARLRIDPHFRGPN